MSDRAVSLDIRTLGGDAGSLTARQDRGQTPEGDAGEDLIRRFTSALLANPAPVAQDPIEPRASPFSLLRELASAADGSRAAPADTVADQPADVLPNVTTDRPVAADAAIVDAAVDGSTDRALDRTSARDPILTGPLFPGVPIAGNTAHAGSDGGDNAPQSRQLLLQMVAETAARMLVGDGSQGRREVRIELSESTLPGVSLSVYEASGEWVAHFTCTQPHSFDILSLPAPQMAQSLADALRKPACWLVEIEPPEREPVEARALPVRAPAT